MLSDCFRLIKSRFAKNSHLLKASGGEAIRPKYKGRGTNKCRGNEKDDNGSISLSSRGEILTFRVNLPPSLDAQVQAVFWHFPR
jgi:hypothetical protein